MMGALWGTTQSLSNKDTLKREELSFTPLTKEELTLMYQTFIYRSEHHEAYRVAKEALKHSPDDPVWIKRAAKVALWSGYSAESIRHWLHLYEITPSDTLRKQLIQKGVRTYQYEQIVPLVQSELLHSPIPKNIDNFVYVLEQAGLPIKVADTLFNLYKKTPRQKRTLTEALRLYLSAGMMDKAQAAVKQMEEDHFSSQNSIRLRANYFYIMRDLNRAYEVLSQITSKQTVKDDLLRWLSDIGWYLGKTNKALEASERLMKIDKAKLYDYERIIASTLSFVLWDTFSFPLERS
jgi:hypothetical protein